MIDSYGSCANSNDIDDSSNDDNGDDNNGIVSDSDCRTLLDTIKKTRDQSSTILSMRGSISKISVEGR